MLTVITRFQAFGLPLSSLGGLVGKGSADLSQSGKFGFTNPALVCDISCTVYLPIVHVL